LKFNKDKEEMSSLYKAEMENYIQRKILLSNIVQKISISSLGDH